MKNLKKSNKTIDDSLLLVADHLQNPKREFFNDNRARLRVAFEEYDQKANAGNLEGLKPIWNNTDGKTYTVVKKGIPTQVTKTHRELAYDLYGSSRGFVQKLWEELEILNSQDGKLREEIICPICGLKHCSQMDHHAPRALDKFPEYSAHLSNMIPLCDTCNETKHDYWTEIENGVNKRIWFNPYFDTLPNFELFLSRIDIIASAPKAIVELSHNLDRSIEIHDVICRTVSRLGLLQQYESELNILLSSNSEKWIIKYGSEKTRYKDIDDYVGSISQEIVQLLRVGKRQTAMEILLYKAIVNSPVYIDWLKFELQKK